MSSKPFNSPKSMSESTAPSIGVPITFPVGVYCELITNQLNKIHILQVVFKQYVILFQYVIH